MADAEYALSIHEKVVLDDVFEKYGAWTAAALGNETKRTEPWLKAVEFGRKTLDLSVIAPPDSLAHIRGVLSRIDRSQRGTAEELAQRNAEVEQWMRPYRSRATGER
jgi:hypothetical protein